MGAESNNNSGKKDILIVEDSDAQAVSLTHILTQEGYTVSRVRNGVECLGLIREHKPTLIISDILMPDMDGYQLCKSIKDSEAHRDIPVILLTQLGEIEDILKGLEAGAENYVTKPFSKEYLLSKIESLCNPSFGIRFRNNTIEKCIEVLYKDRAYKVQWGRGQVLNFLISTYENSVLQNKELTETQTALRILNEELEEKVNERTAALSTEVAERKTVEEKRKQYLEELERFNRLMVGRELRMEELKQEVRTLKKKIKELENNEMPFQKLDLLKSPEISKELLSP